MRRVAGDAIELLNLLRVRLVTSPALVSAGPGLRRGSFGGDSLDGCCSCCGAGHHDVKQVASTDPCRKSILHGKPPIAQKQTRLLPNFNPHGLLVRVKMASIAVNWADRARRCCLVALLGAD